MTSSIINNIKRDIKEVTDDQDMTDQIELILEDATELYQYENNELIEMIEVATEELKRRLS